MQLLYTENSKNLLIQEEQVFINVGNLDISKILTENLSVAFGSDLDMKLLKL
jgi:hypothetical protein